jgi:hypothetical protein
MDVRMAGIGLIPGALSAQDRYKWPFDAGSRAPTKAADADFSRQCRWRPTAPERARRRADKRRTAPAKNRAFLLAVSHRGGAFREFHRAPRPSHAYLARLMLSGLALVALLAQPNAVHSPAVTAQVNTTIELAPWRASPDALPGSRTRVMNAALGGFASALAVSLTRFSRDPTVETTPSLSIRIPSWVPGGHTRSGWLLPGVGQGLYIGHETPIRAEIFPYREYTAAKPALNLPGPHVRMDATMYLTPRIGIRLDASVGRSMYGALSIVIRGW